MQYKCRYHTSIKLNFLTAAFLVTLSVYLSFLRLYSLGQCRSTGPRFDPVLRYLCPLAMRTCCPLTINSLLLVSVLPTQWSHSNQNVLSKSLTTWAIMFCLYPSPWHYPMSFFAMFHYSRNHQGLRKVICSTTRHPTWTSMHHTPQENYLHPASLLTSSLSQTSIMRSMRRI